MATTTEITIQPTAIDIESGMMSYETPIPEVVCMSFANHTQKKVELIENVIEGFGITLQCPTTSIVGHNIAFDLSLICFQYPYMWDIVFKAYDEGRIYDTMMRERLLMLTTSGEFYYDHTRNMKVGYALVDLEKKYLGIDRHELKEDPDAWRYNYIKLLHVPMEDWPPEAVDYSRDDSGNDLAIYYKQEEERGRIIAEQGFDPFAVETFRNKVAFALRLLECKGEKVDPERIREVTQQYEDAYSDPELVTPLTEAGLLVPGQPPVPHARGVKNHAESCCHNKNHVDYKAGRKQCCDCPPKMKAATEDKMSTIALHRYMWSLAFQTDGDIKVWPAKKCPTSPKNMDGKAFSQEYVNSTQGVLPPKTTLQADDEWTTTYADKDSLLMKYVQRKSLAKICTDYLPKLHHEVDGVLVPAETLHCSFNALKKTGRCSSSCATTGKGKSKKAIYPGRNAQNVDPRIRPCTIAPDGKIIISTDYSGMELATLAQKCYELFGESVMKDNINAGKDNHAYLASQIAVHLDPGFAFALKCKDIDLEDRNQVFDAFLKCKGSDMRCNGAVPKTTDAIKVQYKAEHDEEHDDTVTWGEFFKFYRRLAKPTGLGFPGGLGPPTMVTYAKGTYKVDMTEDTARLLRNIWLDTYPEMEMYLLWIKNHCRDQEHKAHYEQKDGRKRLHQYYTYTTPLGMKRARCDYCACANGAGLQSPSAEGALSALYEVTKACYLAKESEDMMFGCYPFNFVHDEILWETPEDKFVNDRVAYVDKIMVDEMEKVTPDVLARTESAAMRRWYKEAEATYDDKGHLIPWEPEDAETATV